MRFFEKYSLKKLLGLQLYLRRLQHRCFPVSILKFLRTPIFKNICERLLLSRAENSTNLRIFLFKKSRIQNPVKHLRWSFCLRAVETIFANTPLFIMIIPVKRVSIFPLHKHRLQLPPSSNGFP